MYLYNWKALLVFAIPAAIACGPGIEATEAPPRGSVPITLAELKRTDFGTALEAVERLRPMWLASAESSKVGSDASTKDGGPRVYALVRCGGITCLRWLEANRVVAIRYLSADDAEMQWSIGSTNGVIAVTLGSP